MQLVLDFNEGSLSDIRFLLTNRLKDANLIIPNLTSSTLKKSSNYPKFQTQAGVLEKLLGNAIIFPMSLPAWDLKSCLKIQTPDY